MAEASSGARQLFAGVFAAARRERGAAPAAGRWRDASLDARTNDAAAAAAAAARAERSLR